MSEFITFFLDTSVSFIVVAMLVTGFLTVMAILFWISEWLLNLLAKSINVHNEFREFLWRKYVKKEKFTPTINSK